MKATNPTINKIKTPKSNFNLSLPLLTSRVRAGSPCIVSSYINGYIDLNQFLIKNPQSTYFFEVEGDSFINEGIYHGDLVIVDRGHDADIDSIAVIAADDGLTLKKITMDKEKDFKIWGVVTYVIHKL